MYNHNRVICHGATRIDSSTPKLFNNKTRPSSYMNQRTTTTDAAGMSHGNYNISESDMEPPFYYTVEEHLEQSSEVDLLDFRPNTAISIDSSLTEGIMVEIILSSYEPPLRGVIRWIGTLDGNKKCTAGVELEDRNKDCSNGMYHGKRYFNSPYQTAMFVPLSLCRKDSRFLSSLINNNEKDLSNADEDLSLIENQLIRIRGNVPPPRTLQRDMVGTMKGIQGDMNSCYLDVTLYCMFAFTDVFDVVINKPLAQDAPQEYCKVKTILKEFIVNPLRKNYFVRAKNIHLLRLLLHKVGISGVLNEEKDPEEVFNKLFPRVCRAEPFIKMRSAISGQVQAAYFYQLFIERDNNIVLPDVQMLFEQSFLLTDLKLVEVPARFIVQLPRCGREYKMYNKIIPNMRLDITDVLEDCPHRCISCGALAKFECKDCYSSKCFREQIVCFCDDCVIKAHSHPNRRSHKYQILKGYDDYREQYSSSAELPREYLELFAVICIAVDHYVAFVKCGSYPDSPWCFFNSMAKRIDNPCGYYEPEVVIVKDVHTWLDSREKLLTTPEADIPFYIRKLTSDCYMCLYRNRDVAQFR